MREMCGSDIRDSLNDQIEALQSKLTDLETRHQAELAGAYLAVAKLCDSEAGIANEKMDTAASIFWSIAKNKIIALTPDTAKKALALRDVQMRLDEEVTHVSMSPRSIKRVAELEAAVRELGGKVE